MQRQRVFQKGGGTFDVSGCWGPRHDKDPQLIWCVSGAYLCIFMLECVLRGMGRGMVKQGGHVSRLELAMVKARHMKVVGNMCLGVGPTGLFIYDMVGIATFELVEMYTLVFNTWLVSVLGYHLDCANTRCII